jgi:hypothetical protein
LDAAKLSNDLLHWTAQWSYQRETYPTQPSGDSVAAARSLWSKYAEALKAATVQEAPVKPDAGSL